MSLYGYFIFCIVFTQAEETIDFENAMSIAETMKSNVAECALPKQERSFIETGSNNFRPCEFYGHELSSLMKGMQDLSKKFKPIDSNDNFALAKEILQTVVQMLEFEKPWAGLGKVYIDKHIIFSFLNNCFVSKFCFILGKKVFNILHSFGHIV
jgi:hypothetical protein